MELNSSEDFDTYLKTLNYLVVYPDKTTKFYKSLRSISEDIYVDYTTISKRLKDESSCMVICRLNNFMFYIKNRQNNIKIVKITNSTCFNMVCEPGWSKQ